MINIWLAFLTGLTSGGISCLAVQGGLLTSSVNPKYNKTLQVITFLVAKLFAYTLLGAFLGQIGALFTFSPIFMAILQIIVGIYMLATAARFLNLHPIFRYTVIQPPSFIYKSLKISTKNQSFFAPLILGLGTILLPCGVTQAMLILSASSGSLLNGALIMLAFILGTSPLFLLIGITFTELFKKKFFSYTAACLILILGLISINNGLNLMDSKFTFQTLLNKKNSISNSVNIINGLQEATIEVTSGGYRVLTGDLAVNVPVKLTIISNNVYSCARAFIIPSQNISLMLPQSGNTVIEFTPTKTGRLTFTCSMGMYSGFFSVVK